MNYRIKNNLATLGFAGVILLIVLLVVGSLWLQIFAPCEYVDWLPTKDVPSRCLSVSVR